MQSGFGRESQSSYDTLTKPESYTSDHRLHLENPPTTILSHVHNKIHIQNSNPRRLEIPLPDPGFNLTPAPATGYPRRLL